MIKPPKRRNTAQFILRIWVGDDNKVHLNRNDLVLPYRRKTFSSPEELASYLADDFKGFGESELFNAAYNCCNMGTVDPDLSPRERRDLDD